LPYNPVMKAHLILSVADQKASAGFSERER
jgi:hypothetical protein